MYKTDITEESYYKYIHWSFVVSGLWPFQSSVRNKRCRLIGYIALITIWLPQILAIKNHSGESLNIIIESLLIFVWYLYILLRYTFLCLHQKKFSFMLNKALDLKTISNQTEVKIIVNMFGTTRFYAILHVAYAFFAIITVVILQMVPYAIDIFGRSENQTQLKVFENRGDYNIIINLDNHPVAKNMYLYFVSGFAIFIQEGFDLFFLLGVAHACTLIRILCLKLSNFGKEDEDNDGEIRLISNAILRQEIKNIVQIHCEIFKYIDALENTFCFSHMVNLFLCIVLAPLSSYVVQYCLETPLMAAQVVVFCLAFVLELLFFNLVGQRLIDESEQIIKSANWYKIPIEFRKSLCIIMMRSLKPIQLSAGKIIILSAATYAEAMKSVVSYFTLLLTIF